MDHYYALLPLAAAVIGAAITKRIIISLAFGLLIGTLLKSKSILGMILFAGDSLAGVVSDKTNAYIILFLFCFGALAEIFKTGGGISGFATAIKPYIKSEKGALMTIWAATPISFLDCCFHVIATTTISKPIVEDLNASKLKAAFIINTTSSQLVVLIPFATTYVGYILGLISSSMQKAGLSGNSYMTYLSGVFLNFYSILMIAVSILVIFFNLDFSRLFQRLLNRKTQKDESQGEHDAEEAHEQGDFDEKTSPRLRNLLIPLAFLIALIFFLLWWTGHGKGRSFFQAIINAEYEKSIFVATIATLVLTLLLYVFQRISMKKIESSFLTGGVDLLPPIVILILAWAITDVTKALGFHKFVSSLITTSFPHQLIPLIVFLVGGLVSYFMGSSWGTWALIMPIAFSLAASTGASIPLTVGAVLAGGSIGDNLSPLGETPVTTSAIMGVPITEHVKYALPFGLVVVVISALLYTAAGYFVF